MNFRDFFARHNAYQDSVMESFVSQLQSTLHSAQANMTMELMRRLSIERGRVARTSTNRRVLGQVESMFAASMRRAGYDSLINEFVGSFNGQFRFMDEILQELSAAMKTPLAITKQTRDTAVAFQGNARNALASVADAVGLKAAQQTLFSVGGMKFDDLVALLTESFSLTIPQATGLAATLQTTFFRTIQDSEYQQIEATQPKGAHAIRYIYDGPKDKLNRPFCKDRVGKSYSRKQIDKMDNGQLPDVMRTCGGWRCRHQFVMDMASIMPMPAKRAKAVA
jgi:hypothetical protein